MITKLVKSIKIIVMFSVILFGIIACEKDFENIGVGLVDNDLFKTSSIDFEVVANTKNVEASRVDRLPVRNLGILKDDATNNFGTLKASLITQLGVPTTYTDFAKNAVIDTVILDIPYYATKINNSNKKNEYRLDSVFGNQDIKYKLKVSRLQTYLNTLDPNDPTKSKKYYSDEVLDVTNDVFFYDNFKPNKNDTVLFVKRHFFREAKKKESDPFVVDIDTLATEKKNPSLKLPLNENLVKEIFLNADASNYSSSSRFTNYFRGIYINVEEIGTNGGSMMTLDTKKASIKIYYTYENGETKNEVKDDKDYNFDGDKLDETVPVKVKATASLSFSGLSTSVYNRNYLGSSVLNSVNSNTTYGQSEVFIQGSAGSNVEIDLFKGFTKDSFGKYREKNWLINGAVLDLYIKDSTNAGVPSKLYLFKADNTIIKDVFSEAGTTGISGGLRRDKNGKPEKYTFYLTDYISDILKRESSIEPPNLILKTYHPSDFVDPRNVIDTIVKDFSWDVKGVVLKGNKLPKTTDNKLDPERIKLKIYYTENSKK